MNARDATMLAGTRPPCLSLRLGKGGMPPMMGTKPPWCKGCYDACGDKTAMSSSLTNPTTPLKSLASSLGVVRWRGSPTEKAAVVP